MALTKILYEHVELWFPKFFLRLVEYKLYLISRLIISAVSAVNR